MEVAAAQAEMMRMAKAAIGAEKILLLNNGAAIPALFAIGDAFMFEHYSPASISKEAIVNDWALMKKIAAANKITVWRIGLEQQPEGRPVAEVLGESRQQREQRLESISQQQLDFYLAAFLIGAQEYSYFQYGWGWRLETGPLVAYPLLTKRVGKPLGEFSRLDPDGWRFTRDFEQVRVSVDLEHRTGHLAWDTAPPASKP